MRRIVNADGSGSRARLESVEFDGFHTIRLEELAAGWDARATSLRDMLPAHHLLLRHPSGVVKALVF